MLSEGNCCAACVLSGEKAGVDGPSVLPTVRMNRDERENAMWQVRLVLLDKPTYWLLRDLGPIET